MPIGHRLKEERERIGISQGDAALLAGVSRNSWGSYEREESVPGAGVLVALMGHGFDVNYILGGMRLLLDDDSLSERERELLNLFRATDNIGRDAIQRAATMEAMRSRQRGSLNVFAPRPMTATRVQAHEPPPGTEKPKRRRKD